MKLPVMSGLVVGAVSAALSWYGHRSLSPHLVSTFPDLLTLISLPLLVAVAVWLQARRDAGDPRHLRRVGLTVAAAAALVFAASSAWLAAVRFSTPSSVTSLLAIGAAAIAAFALGTLGAFIGRRLARPRLPERATTA